MIPILALIMLELSPSYADNLSSNRKKIIICVISTQFIWNNPYFIVSLPKQIHKYDNYGRT
jgi:hypothetical protein